jgi:hypothetical protein
MTKINSWFIFNYYDQFDHSLMNNNNIVITNTILLIKSQECKLMMILAYTFIV